MQNKISIIVPIYKVEKYIEKCLQTLVGQTYTNTEIILIDDGSPDNSGEICEKYAEKYENIKLIHQENAGVSVARNNGLDNATGEYVLFVDPDDFLETDCCETLIKAAEGKNYDVIYFMDRELNELTGESSEHECGETRELTADDIRRIQIDTIGINYRGFGFHSGTPWGKFFRRSFLEKNHFRFTPGVVKAQDVLLNTQMYEKIENALFINYVGYVYRINEGSSNIRFNPKIVEGTRLLVEGLGEVADLHPDDADYRQKMGNTSLDRLNFIERLYIFNKNGNVTKKEAIKIYRDYLNIPAVKKYMKYYNIGRARNSGEKIRAILLKYKLTGLYYTILKLRYK